MKRRYKLLIGFIITGIILIIIFFITRDKKMYYLSLGDSISVGNLSNSSVNYNYSLYIKEYLEDRDILEFYTNEFSKSNYRSIDLYNDIKNNKKIKVNNKEISIKNALIKADIVTLGIGTNDLFYKFNLETVMNLNEPNDIYSYVDEVLKDVNKLLYELRLSCKEQIIVLGFFNPFISSSNLYNNIEPIIEYANAKMEDLVHKYDMTFVDIDNIFVANENYLYEDIKIYPTKDGYKAISKEIINLIDNKYINKNY